MFYKHLKSVLPLKDCESLIHFSEDNGFSEATVDYYGEKRKVNTIRNNSRLEWDNVELSLKLEKILQEKLMLEFPYIFERFVYAKTNSHFRMYKYIPGQYFKPHKDGHFQQGEEETHITVLFYLNDTDGGETILMPKGYSSPQDFITIKPMKGDVLLFEHGIWHEGKPVNSGEKYVLRTDLFYKFN